MGVDGLHRTEKHAPFDLAARQVEQRRVVQRRRGPDLARAALVQRCRRCRKFEAGDFIKLADEAGLRDQVGAGV